MRSLVLVACWLVACGDSAPSADSYVPTFTSGSRIRAQVYVASDGFKTLAGWYDSTLDYSCSFDGVEFMICPYAVDDSDFPAPSERFSDAACTLPFFRAVSSNPNIVQYRTTSTHYYQVTSGTAEVYRLNGVLCEDAGQLPGTQVVAELTTTDMGLPTLTDHTTSDGVAYASADSPDGFSAVVKIGGTTTDVMDEAPTRLRNQYAELGMVRRFEGVFDSTLKNVCAFGATDGSSLASCTPFGDNTSDITTGLTTPDCSLAGAIRFAPTAGVRNDVDCEQPVTAQLYIMGDHPTGKTCDLFAQITGYKCLPITNLASATLVTE